jgi:hypothetical protein
VPTEAAAQLAWLGRTDEEVAEQFEVSVPWARWRMNATGARLRAGRAHAKWLR